MADYYTARAAQEAMQWPLAAKAWRAIGEHTKASACEMIQAANERGDAFRARVRDLQEQGVPYWTALRVADKEYYGEFK